MQPHLVVVCRHHRVLCQRLSGVVIDGERHVELEQVYELTEQVATGVSEEAGAHRRQGRVAQWGCCSCGQVVDSGGVRPSRLTARFDLGRVSVAGDGASRAVCFYGFRTILALQSALRGCSEQARPIGFKHRLVRKISTEKTCTGVVGHDHPTCLLRHTRHWLQPYCPTTINHRLSVGRNAGAPPRLTPSSTRPRKANHLPPLLTMG